MDSEILKELCSAAEFDIESLLEFSRIYMDVYMETLKSMGEFVMITEEQPVDASKLVYYNHCEPGNYYADISKDY